jgi:hypothetical protein
MSWFGKRSKERIDNREAQRDINQHREKAEIAREYGNPNIGGFFDRIANRQQAELDKKKGK